MPYQPVPSPIASSPRYSESIADLIARRGDIAARRAEQSGALWGQALSNIGNVVGSVFQQRQEKKDQEKRDAMFDQALASWNPANPGAFYRAAAVAVGPETATSALRALASIEATKAKGAPDPKDFAPKAEFLKRMKDSNPEWLKKNWGGIAPVIAPEVKALFGLDLGPEWQEEYGQALDAIGQPTKETAGFTLGPREIRFGPKGEKIAEGAPAAEHEMPQSVEQQLAEAALRGDEATYAKLLKVKREVGAAGRVPPESSFQAKEVLNDEGKPVMANFNARTGQYVEVATGKPIKTPRPVPSAGETQDTRKFKQAAPILSAVSELSEKINTLQGVAAKASGEAAKQAAKLNLNDNVAEYEALIQGFTPLVARALGHTGVLTQQDVDSVRMLFPRPGDSKSLRDRKVKRIEGIVGQLSGEPVQTSAPISPKKNPFR